MASSSRRCRAWFDVFAAIGYERSDFLGRPLDEARWSATGQPCYDFMIPRGGADRAFIAGSLPGLAASPASAFDRSHPPKP